MRLEVTFVCDSRIKAVVTPLGSFSKVSFPDYEKSYNIAACALGQRHTAVYDLPEDLDLRYGDKRAGHSMTYEGAVISSFKKSINKNRPRLIEFKVNDKNFP